MNGRRRARSTLHLAGLLASVVFVLASCAEPEPPPSWRGSAYPDTPAAEDFALTDQHGQPFRLSDHRGRVVLLFFGYVHCPDVCPVTLSTWAKVRSGLEDVRDRVEFVFVTVDPERDTPERLAQHLEIFGSDFHGLTGSEEQLGRVYEQYGIFEQKVPLSGASGYVVDHSTRMLLIDTHGRLRLRYPFDADADDIVHDIRLLLDEREPPPVRNEPVLTVVDAWARPTIAVGAAATAPPGAPTAVYLTVENRGTAAARLTGGSTDVAGVVELHETRAEGERMRMVRLEEGAEIPPGQALVLRPGGMHLMLFDLRRHLAPGESFALRLEFANEPAIQVDVPVREP